MLEIAGSDNIFWRFLPRGASAGFFTSSFNPDQCLSQHDTISSPSASVHFVSPNSSHTALSPHFPPPPLGLPASFRPLHLGLIQENHALGPLGVSLFSETAKYEENVASALHVPASAVFFLRLSIYSSEGTLKILQLPSLPLASETLEPRSKPLCSP